MMLTPESIDKRVSREVQPNDRPATFQRSYRTVLSSLFTISILLLGIGTTTMMAASEVAGATGADRLLNELRSTLGLGSSTISDHNGLAVNSQAPNHLRSGTYDFSISVSPEVGNVQTGSQSRSQVTVTALQGISQPVDLAIWGLSAQVGKASTQVSQCTPNPTCTIALEVQVRPDSPNGPFLVRLTGSSGSVVHVATYFFNVIPKIAVSASTSLQDAPKPGEVAPQTTATLYIYSLAACGGGSIQVQAPGVSGTVGPGQQQSFTVTIGSSVTLTATDSILGSGFSAWTGGITGNQNPDTFTFSSTLSVTGSIWCISVNPTSGSELSGGQISAGGVTTTVSITSGQCSSGANINVQGLPSGASWLWNYPSNNQITIGAYQAALGNYALTVSANCVQYPSETVAVSYAFTIQGYSQVFQETGLPGGLQWAVVVAGTPYSTTSSQIAVNNLLSGSYSFTPQSPIAYGQGTQYVTPGGGGFSTGGPPITVPYNVQYALTMQASPSSYGITSPAPGTYWENAGNFIGISATANSGYQFTGWTGTGSGSYTGANNYNSININAPIAEIANFAIVPDFTISASSSAFVPADGSTQATSTISISAVNGFTGTVTLSDTPLPTGLTCTPITPASVTGSGTASLSCTSTSPGTYQVTITGNSGALNHPATATFTYTTLAGCPPKIFLGTPSVSALNVTVNGETLPCGSGTSITSISWTWGDGGSTVSWFPANYLYAASGTYTITATSHQSDGETASNSTSVTVSGGQPDFTLTAASPVPIDTSQSATTTISIIAKNGFTGTVTLSDSPLPSGLTCASFSPGTVTGSGTTTLSCSASVAGSYIVTITGTSGSLSHSSTITFNFVDFSLAASSPSGLAGSPLSSTITVTGLDGFVGTVTLSDTVPAGLTCNSIAPSSVSGSGTATLSCNSTAQTTYSVQISGTDGTLTRSTTATFMFGQPPDFSISATQPSSADTGQVISSITSLGAIGGFTSAVSLTDASLPAGLSCASISPASLTPPGSATLSCSSTTAGNYQVTITGTSGSLSHSTTTTFHFADFTMTASSNTVDATQSPTSTITVTSLNGFAGTITLSDTLPSGLTCGSINPGSLAGSGTSSLSCTSSTAGSFSVSISGTDGTVTRAATASFNFGDFGLTATSPSPVDVSQPATSTISITSLNGFAGSVSLSDAPLPNGLTCGAFSPANVVGSGTASLSCNTTTSATYSVVITATDGHLTHTATITMTFQSSEVIFASASVGTLTVGAPSQITLYFKNVGTGPSQASSYPVSLMFVNDPNGPVVGILEEALRLETGQLLRPTETDSVTIQLPAISAGSTVGVITSVTPSPTDGPSFDFTNELDITFQGNTNFATYIDPTSQIEFSNGVYTTCGIFIVTSIITQIVAPYLHSFVPSQLSEAVTADSAMADLVASITNNALVLSSKEADFILQDIETILADLFLASTQGSFWETLAKSIWNDIVLLGIPGMFNGAANCWQPIFKAIDAPSWATSLLWNFMQDLVNRAYITLTSGISYLETLLGGFASWVVSIVEPPGQHDLDLLVQTGHGQVGRLSNGTVVMGMPGSYYTASLPGSQVAVLNQTLALQTSVGATNAQQSLEVYQMTASYSTGTNQTAANSLQENISKGITQTYSVGASPIAKTVLILPSTEVFYTATHGLGLNATISGSFNVNSTSQQFIGSQSIVVVNATTGATLYAKTFNVNMTFNTLGIGRFVDDIPTNPYWFAADCTVNAVATSTDCFVSRTPDITHTGTIGIVDVGIVYADYGYSNGNPKYDPLANLTATGTTNINDAGVIGLYYGAAVFMPQ